MSGPVPKDRAASRAAARRRQNPAARGGREVRCRVRIIPSAMVAEAPLLPVPPGPPAAAPTWAEACSAARRLRQVFPPSPLLPAAPATGERVLLKADSLLPTGSFKVRGIWDAVARLDDRAAAAGLSTVSAGNTALALAWAARRRGVTATSLLPETAPTAKIEAFRAAGGRPRLVPVPELFRFLRDQLWREEPYAFIHPWIEPAVHRGHASLAVELLEAAPDLESVFIPVGGGGLLTGVAGALKDRRPKIQVFAVEPEGCCALHRSLEAGQAIAVPCRTICDGVAVPYLTAELYPVLARLVDRTVLVPEEETLAASRDLLLARKLVAEPSGALAAAAARRVPEAERGLSAALLTGASIGAAGIRRML